MSKQEDKWIIPRERERKLTPAYWYLEVMISERMKSLHGVSLDEQYYIYNNGKVQLLIPSKSWGEMSEIVSKRLLSDLSYIKVVKEELEKEVILANEFFATFDAINLSALSLDELVVIAQEIKQHWISYSEVNIPPWFLGADLFGKQLQAELSITDDDFLVLSSPETKTHTTQLEEELTKVTFDYKNNSLDNLQQAAQELSEKYGWIQLGS